MYCQTSCLIIPFSNNSYFERNAEKVKFETASVFGAIKGVIAPKKLAEFKVHCDSLCFK